MVQVPYGERYEQASALGCTKTAEAMSNMKFKRLVSLLN